MSWDPRRPSTLGLPQRWEVKIKQLTRRMTVLASKAGLWRLEGHEGEYDDDVEVFSGIGFYSRPRESNNAEVIVVKVGAAPNHPVVVATRDEDTRIELDENETAVFNSKAMVRITKDGEILIGGREGTFEPLALRSDVEEVANKFNVHLHTAPTGPTSRPVGVAPPGGGDPPEIVAQSPVGTQTLRAE